METHLILPASSRPTDIGIRNSVSRVFRTRRSSTVGLSVTSIGESVSLRIVVPRETRRPRERVAVSNDRYESERGRERSAGKKGWRGREEAGELKGKEEGKGRLTSTSRSRSASQPALGEEEQSGEG